MGGNLHRVRRPRELGILHIGLDNGPDSPRTIPLGFGWQAPSGVLFAGAVLTLRDVIHDRIGTSGTLAVIAASAPVTALTSTRSLAIASVVTLIVAEIADLLIYARVRSRGRTRAVVFSNTVSGLIDSLLFLTIAFGVTAAVHGSLAMTIGKVVASVITLVLISGVTFARIRHRRGVRPAVAIAGSPAATRSVRE